MRLELLRYLAGRMPDGERSSFDERLIVDQEFSDAVAACEQELIDCFAADALPREEERAVRQWIESSDRRVLRLEMARALLAAQRRRSRFDRRRLVVLAFAACLVAAAGVSVARFELASRRAPGKGLSRVNGGAGSATKPATPIKSRAMATILLVAERSRGEQPPASYKIEQDLPVRVEILLTGDAQRGPYTLRIVSQTRKQPPVIERPNLDARRSEGQTFIDETFDAGSLPPSSYTAIITSEEGTLTAPFTVNP